MKYRIQLAGLCAAFAMSTSVSAIELEHSLGSVTLPSAPETIATFDLGVLDSLHTLGVPVQGVPKSMYEGHLAPYSDATVVGTLFEPDYDVLKELKPDLIVAGRRSQPAMEQLQEIAPTVVFLNDDQSFIEGFKRDNLALASVFAKEEQAQGAINAIESDVKALHEANKGKTGALLFVVNNNVIAHAPGDRFGYAYELTGLESVLPARDPNEPVAPRPEAGSPEAKAAAEARAKTISTLAKAEPDWLIVLDRGAINGAEKTAAATLENHPELSQTAAFKAGRVVYVDPNGWYIIGSGLTNLKAITESLLAQMK
ncbi:MAG TPA: ABC transporter substrate-binding protein [Paenalcaligenes sp.]|nr:ABC transporter substrate-binding protein [Paenalcaligenes sp.]